MTDQKTNTGLSERDILTIKNIFSQYAEVTDVRLFGSRAQGNFRPGSDIDLAIMNKIPNVVLRKISSDFEESSLPYRVDLLDYYSLDHAGLKAQIDRAGIPFYSSQSFKGS